MERRTAAVSVVTVIPPTARRTNLNNTDIFSHGEIEYDLYCDVDGRPAPELNWYKVCSYNVDTLVKVLNFGIRFVTSLLTSAISSQLSGLHTASR